MTIRDVARIAAGLASHASALRSGQSGPAVAGGGVIVVRDSLGNIAADLERWSKFLADSVPTSEVRMDAASEPETPAPSEEATP